MVKNRVLATGLLWLVLSALAWGSDKAPRPYRPILFRVSISNTFNIADRPCSYLLGTQHLGVFPSDLPTYVVDCLSQSKHFLCEADVRAGLGKVNGLPSSNPWLGKLSRKERRELLKLLPPNSESFISGQAPETVYLAMQAYAIVGDALHSMPLHELSMDVFLFHQAEQQGHLLTFLDSPPLQEQALKRVLYSAARPLQLRIAPIRAAISDPNRFQEQNRRVGEQIRALDYVAVSEMESAMSHEDRMQLLSLRNAHWMKSIRIAVNEGGAFIAVGAVHLPGEHGLVERLRAVGFEVELWE